jgi:hypothetical protein
MFLTRAGLRLQTSYASHVAEIAGMHCHAWSLDWLILKNWNWLT